MGWIMGVVGLSSFAATHNEIVSHERKRLAEVQVTSFGLNVIICLAAYYTYTDYLGIQRISLNHLRCSQDQLTLLIMACCAAAIV